MRSGEELALAVQHGDEDALEALITGHLDGLVGYLYRLGGEDRGLAEDIAQETFVQVIRQIDRYEYPRPFKAWLYGIATNIAHNAFNRGDARRTAGGDEVIEAMVGQDEAVEMQAERAFDMATVEKALGSLPTAQREAILLRYVYEFSLNEISAMLAIPVGTVKSRVSLGLRALRVLVEGN